MKQRTKLILILLLVLILAAAGVFFWKGGHHAIYISDVLEDWLDADNANQSVTVQLQFPGFSPEDDTLRPQVRQFILTADSFWTEYRDRNMYGLTVEGMTAYVSGGVLYWDTGSAYTLPQPPRQELRELGLGLLIYGRVTRDGDTYRISMETEGLDLSASVIVDGEIRSLSITAALPDGQVLQVTVIPQPPTPHPLPQTVTDAMDRARTEPPMAILEPLNVLLPAMESLFPLEGQLNLGVSCGILELDETVGLTIDGTKAQIDRTGILVDIELPPELSQFPAEVLAFGLLRNGEFVATGSGGTVTIPLSGQSIQSLCIRLVPQAADLGITFENSVATLTFTGGNLKTVSLSASGTVPFLFTEIPISFQTDLITH